MWLKLIDEVIEDTRYSDNICISQNSHPYFPPLNYKNKRASRIVSSVCLKNEFEWVKLLKRLLLGGVSESPPGKTSLSDLVPILKQPGEAKAPGSTSLHSVRLGVKWGEVGTSVPLPPISACIPTSPRKVTPESHREKKCISFTIQNNIPNSNTF